MHFANQASVSFNVFFLHFLEFIYKSVGEEFDLVNITVGRCLSEGDTLGCIQHEEKVNRTI